MSNASNLVQQAHQRAESARVHAIAAALLNFSRLDHQAQQQPTDADAAVLVEAMRPGGLPVALRSVLYPGRPASIDHLTETCIDTVVANIKRYEAASAASESLRRVDLEALVKQRREELRAAKATAAQKMRELMRPITIAETTLLFAERKASEKQEADRELSTFGQACQAIFGNVRPSPSHDRT